MERAREFVKRQVGYPWSLKLHDEDLNLARAFQALDLENARLRKLLGEKIDG